MAKDPSLPYYLTIAERGRNRFMPFQSGLAWSETLSWPGFEPEMLIPSSTIVTLILSILQQSVH